MKRKKLAERLSAGNTNATSSAPADLQSRQKVYKGYVLWRDSDYKEQKELLSNLLRQSGMPYDQYNALGDARLAKISHLLKILSTFKMISVLEQFAVVTQIRIEIEATAGDFDQDHESYADPVCEMLLNTELRSRLLSSLSPVSQELRHGEILRMIKLEALWTMSNLAYSSNDAVDILIHGPLVINNAQDGAEPNDQKLEDERHQFFKILKEMAEKETNDLQTIDQLMDLFGNMSGSSKELK